MTAGCEVLYYFSERIAKARSFGINDIIIDPGFGFAKTIEQNFTLLKEMNFLKKIDVPLLAGLSRKSMIYKTKINQVFSTHLIYLFETIFGRDSCLFLGDTRYDFISNYDFLFDFIGGKLS